MGRDEPHGAMRTDPRGAEDRQPQPGDRVASGGPFRPPLKGLEPKKSPRAGAGSLFRRSRQPIAHPFFPKGTTPRAGVRSCPLPGRERRRASPPGDAFLTARVRREAGRPCGRRGGSLSPQVSPRRPRATLHPSGRLAPRRNFAQPPAPHMSLNSGALRSLSETRASATGHLTPSAGSFQRTPASCSGL